MSRFFKGNCRFATKNRTRKCFNQHFLNIIDNEPQKFIPNAYFKGVYLDMMCKLSDKRVVNVEIQLYEEKNEAKRIFYYASMIEEAFVDKGTKYEDISDIIIIYLTKDDIFKLGSTVYDVDMEVVSDTKKIVKKWNCGLQVKYVNTVGLTNKTINEYLKLLSDNVTYNTKYKKTNEIKKDILTIDGGKRSMSVFYELTKDYYEEGVEKGIKQGRQEGRQKGMKQGEAKGVLNTLISLAKEGLLSVKDAAKKVKMSEEEFKKLLTT